MRLMLAASFFVVAPFVVHAAEPDPRQTMISAFEASQCVLTLDQINDAFKSAGLDKDAVQPTARQLAADGMLGMIDNDTGFLKTGAVCDGFVPPAVEADPAVLADVIETFEAGQCRLNVDDQPFRPLEETYDRKKIDTALANLLNAGLMTFEGAEAILTTGDLCGS